MAILAEITGPLLTIVAMAGFVVAVVAMGLALHLQRRVGEQDKQLKNLHERLRSQAAPRSVGEQPTPAPPAVVKPSPTPAEKVVQAIARPASPVKPPPPPPLPPTEPKKPTEAAAPPKPAAFTPAPDKVPMKEVAEPPSSSWEERLGAKAAVWIGAVALALAGAYLVKYSFDNNLISPAVRVLLGAAFGVGLLIGAQPLYRRAENIAAAMAAAGVADLFACALAATRLYHFLTPTVGFLCMAAVAGTGVVLSLRHGRLVAVVGLIGGFITPALIGANVPDARVTFSYLFLLQMGLIAVTRRRGWWMMALLTMAGSLTWSAAFLVMIAMDWVVDYSGPWVGLFLLSTVGSFVVAGWSTGAAPAWGRAAVGRVLTWMSTLGALFLFACLIGVEDFAVIDWLLLAMLAASMMALARLRPIYLPVVWMIGGAVAIMLTLWARQLPAERTNHFLAIQGVFFALFTGGGFALMWRSGRETFWALLAAVAPIALLVIGERTDVPLPGTTEWWMIGVGLAVVVTALACAATAAQRELGKRRDNVLSLYVTSAATLLALAALVGPEERMWLGPMWMGIALAVTILACRLRLGPLQLPITTLGLLAACQIVLDWNAHAVSLAPTVILNELFAVYAATIVGLLAVAVIVRLTRLPIAPLPTIFELTAWTLTAIAAAVQVRHGFALVVDNTVDLGRGEVSLNEIATYATVWLALACGFSLLYRRVRWYSLRLPTPVLLWLGVVVSFGLLTVFNPVLNPDHVGDAPIINGLLYAYGVPTALAALLARLTRRTRWPSTPTAAGVLSLVMGLALITLQVRHLFHGSDMALSVAGRAGVPEWSSYINLWLALGIGAWLLGRVRQSRAAQAVGIVIVLLGAATAVWAIIAVTNPLHSDRSVGEIPILNWLMTIHAVPAALCVVAAGLMSERYRVLARLLQVIGLLLLFAFVSLEVRQYFHGPILAQGEVTSAEWYTYSAVWVALGIVLLVAGLLRRNPVLRYASLAVMGLAVGKVFLSDTAHLDNLYRVLSFLGLGVSLLLLGFVYQRFVFRRVE